MKKISVIIPVYNVEKFLQETMQTVLNQTYKNLEIILVDDGSTDSSGKLCDEYEKIDSRVRVIHQANKGLSGARNTGMEHATGEYIMFIDSDDTYELNSCEVLYKAINETNSDFVSGNYRNMTEQGEKWNKPAFDTQKHTVKELSIKNPKESFYLMNSGVWNKIFKKSFLEKIEIKFAEKFIAEDAIFTTLCFMRASKVFYISDVVYNYRLRDNGSISSSATKNYFLEINRAYRMIYENFKKYNEIEFYRYYYAKSMNYILYKFIDSNIMTKEEKVEVLYRMKWFYLLSYELKIPTNLKTIKYIIESMHEGDFEQTLKYCDLLNQLRKLMPPEMKEKMSKPSESTYTEIEEKDIDLELLKEKTELLEEINKSPLIILNTEESIKKIKKQKKSVARFGDEELDIILGKDLKSQEYDKKLAERLKEILKSKQAFCMVGIPDVLNGFFNLTEESEKFWIKNIKRTREAWLKYTDKTIQYCSANLNRLYIRYEDKSNCGYNFSQLMSIWKNRDVVICEGEQTRVGVGNDLLGNCKSVKRILCPTENAFSKYDEILERLKQENKDSLIIIVLGPTATVLAYDLGKNGYQALDLGNFDLEYEWYKRSVKRKTNKKHTNEYADKTKELIDVKYKNEIDTIIQ